METRFNSQVSSWFCRTNDPLICRYPVLNVVVPEKCFKGLPLKFYFRPFGGIRSNRKWNLKSAVNWKRQPEMVCPVGIEGFKAWGMAWASQIGLIMCYLLAIYTLGCREPAWNLGPPSWGVNFFETWLSSHSTRSLQESWRIRTWSLGPKW